MALVIIYAVLSHFDFVAKFTVKNLNKDFTNTGRGGGHHFVKVFHKILVFFKRWLPLVENFEKNAFLFCEFIYYFQICRMSTVFF